MSIREIIERLVVSPEYFWEENTRQAEKLRKRVHKAKNTLTLTGQELVEDVFQIAESRLNAGSRTVFLSNIGSSGSHLFQACIANAWETIPLGEVYLPPSLIEVTDGISGDDLHLLAECYLLLHDVEFKNRYKQDAIIINTLHHPSLSRFGVWSKNFSSALIVRNPVEIVLSRSFRKNEYRSYLGGDQVSDWEYLKLNANKVAKFFHSAKKYNHDAVLKFEDLCSVESDVLRGLKALVDDSISDSDLKAIIDKTLGDGASTNKFQGVRDPVPTEIITYVENEMREVSELYGYGDHG